MLVAISVSCLTITHSHAHTHIGTSMWTATYPVHNANIIYRVNHSAHIQAMAIQPVNQSFGPQYKNAQKKNQPQEARG